MSVVRTRLYVWDEKATTWRNPEGVASGHPFSGDERAIGNMAVVRFTGDGLSDSFHFCAWTNCDGRHLWTVLPSGNVFDWMSRAANCGMPADKEHRCWIVHGLGTATPTVDKEGRTCVAGAGSVIDGNWHGFLREGALTT